MPVVDVSTAQQVIDAIQGAHAGDEIVLAAGDYAFTGNINASAVGTQAMPIKVHGPAGGGANITFGSATTLRLRECFRVLRQWTRTIGISWRSSTPELTSSRMRRKR